MKAKLIFFGLMLLPSLSFAAGAFNPPSAALVPAAPVAVASPYNFNLTYSDAETAVANEITAKGDGGPVSVTILGKKLSPLYVYTKPITAEVHDLNIDNSGGRWSANILVVADGAVVSAMPLSGRYNSMVELPVLKHQMRAGDIISEGDVELKQFAADRNHSDTITDIAALIGKAPLRGISAARQIRVAEVGVPKLIKKNAKVTMRYEASGMEITTIGTALTDGAKDEVIDVLNPTSKKTLRATVVDANTVDVMGQGAQAAQLIAAPTTGGQKYER